MAPSPLTRLLLLCFLPACLGTCVRAPQGPPTRVVGTLRYEQDGNVVSADVRVTPTDAGTPTLFGAPLLPLPDAGPGVYKMRREVNLTGPFDLTAPGPAGEARSVRIDLSPPRIDSLPARLNKRRGVAFPTLTRFLTEDENLILFLEPADRGQPRQILLQGPSSTLNFTLPRRALADVAPGAYSAYLILQQLQRDSTAHLDVSFQTEYYTTARPVVVTDEAPR